MFTALTRMFNYILNHLSENAFQEHEYELALTILVPATIAGIMSGLVNKFMRYIFIKIDKWYEKKKNDH